MKSATLYFHYPCFDGLVSGVLAWEFLETHRQWTIGEFNPVNYTLRNTWLSKSLPAPCAIVDFLYHPSAEFWADHHQTSMLTPEARADFERRKPSGFLLFDDRAGSCASLLFRHFRQFFAGNPHFAAMVDAAEKIDTAAYSSVEEAILGDDPALQISRTLLIDETKDYAVFLLRELRSHGLAHVAALPEVKSRHDEVRRRILAGLKQVESQIHIERGEIATFEAHKQNDAIVSRYAAYYFAPHARYSIGVIRSEEGAAITAMRNPWMEFDSIPLGRAFEKFGGGGHQRVGSVFIAKNQSQRVQDVVESLLSQMS